MIYHTLGGGGHDFLSSSIMGMVISDPEEMTDLEKQNSIIHTKSLTDKIIAQNTKEQADHSVVLENKKKVPKVRAQR